MTQAQNTRRSVLVTTVGRPFVESEVEQLAQHLNVTIRPLVDGEPTIANALAHATDEAVLYTGTGNYNFDLRAAAALGVGVIVLADTDELGVQLARTEAEELGAVLIDVATETPDYAALATAAATTDVEVVMNADVFEHWLLAKAKEKRAHIVLPEGDDDRILTAAGQLLAEDVCELTILGNPDSIRERSQELGVDLSKAQLLDPDHSPLREEFAADFFELRKHKGVTEESAHETMGDISYFATMMIHKGLADGMVSGAAHTTAHTIKPSFQIIKTQPGASVVSSIFLMVMRGRLWAFGDCAVNPNPTAEQLGEIAVVSARTAAQFGIEPRVAMLSYSTGTSGTGPDVDRCVAAVNHARSLDATVLVDGPLQFDAAVDPGVAKKKMPESAVAGQANVFIFPDLEAGNIGYKTAQRTGHALAVGPILQGLNKPVNDLSRGATVPDIVNTVAITAIQAAGMKES
ncbi:MAG: phosphate acetyltransferase [Corynebacterium sp.]|uniref:phosphate acetyltransferase n=1 Tax=Corynebacterium sp. TaxID=1720 RepID=UPI0026DC8C1A|nr:phosphate acetyltransferase [Corynebacterium sp.]MDO4760639.1 phosphate acetyltransferase [Corynebacterium sp.]